MALFHFYMVIGLNFRTGLLYFLLCSSYLIYCEEVDEENDDVDESLYFSDGENVIYCDSRDYNRLCCKNDEFHCNQGLCIKETKVCDMVPDKKQGRFDCLDGSDELGCADVPCKYRNGKCDQLCVDYPSNKSQCSCHKGYTLSWDEKCIDIDECDIGIHSCSHGCINLNGTFACTCRTGFKDLKNISVLNSQSAQIKPNQFCQHEDETILVMYKFVNWIYWYDVNDKKTHAFIRAVNISSIDYDPVSDMFYWYNRSTLSRTFLPGAKGGYVTVGHSQVLQIPDLENVVGNRLFSFDWITGNIYWVKPNSYNSSNSDILVSKVNSTLVKSVKTEPKITSMVVDPPSGIIYWISGDEYIPFIGKCGISTLLLQDVWITTKIYLKGQKPHSLAIDHLSDGRIYWVDSKFHVIYYMFKTEVTAWKVHTTSRERSPNGLDIFDGYIYWLTNGTNELMRINKFGMGKEEVLKANILGSTQATTNIIKVYHSSKFDKSINYGQKNCENCSHFCFNHGPSRGYQCSCPDQVEFASKDKCDIDKELDPKDPLDCNCYDFEIICNVNSPYIDCICHREYCYGNYTDPTLESNTFHISILNYIFIISLIVLIILMYVLSCFKRHT